MSRLTRDGTAETVSRDQTLRHERGQGNTNFPCSADHGQDWQPYPINRYPSIVYAMAIYTCRWPLYIDIFNTEKLCVFAFVCIK